MENAVAEKTVIPGRASIILVSYNSLSGTTAPCLESVFANTDYPDYEVIVVDNNSSDGTPGYLRELAGREPRLKPILNSVNRGFAGGNNDGLKVATGEFLVLLNNDTQVGRGWLTELVRPLREDPTAGLVGPVSNATGNEQEVWVESASPKEILGQGALWVGTGRSEAVSMERLCFFCVATRRDVVERVGGLDEAYGLGFYEDDDYCLRVRRAGFTLLLNENVFIYHRGSGSFSAMPGTTKKLLKANRKLLERKFGIRRYRTTHPRERHLELIAQALQRLASGQDDTTLYRVENRLKKAELLRPRGFWKRLRFDYQLKSLKRKLAGCRVDLTEGV
ncbi:glycosyltransferase family 2 protein [Geomonas sp. Red32]|uniref:glycosyltransferase family 2 protein n=1 Tax=Geomonas sp. Red32 TaxID=2912856 RepID=UPI00202CBE22|nr:glycosyltransferase family 2 protein [Geomonas sp. Red32]MCM0082800.1 glycosyltransferase family 2 protein [Geomonas sp. Red32]